MRLFTSESVTEGHPDKVADQICDAVLDAILEKDPPAHVACECVVKTGLALVTGEISTECYVEIPEIVRDTIRGIGYTRAKYGFDGNTCSVLTAIEDQSPDIAQGVNTSAEARANSGGAREDTTGAGDQGMMFGFACDETAVLMPMPIFLAHRLARRLAEVRRTGALPYLRPDGKTQVTVGYVDGKPARIDAVVVSAQHSPEVSTEQIREDVIREVVGAVLPSHLVDAQTRYFVNPTGRFVIGGPQGDSGLSGRKIIVDTYGGYARHGGGSFSGKDPTKVDRTGSYAARYVAKNIVAAGLASKCEVQVAYVIGVANPVSLMLETFGTGKVPERDIRQAIDRLFDFRPEAIIERFELRRPIYKQVACYGHFGRDDLDLPWERTDMSRDLQGLLG
ncbi:MAG: methionine adenosyltransferase [Ignavibacteriales bacterium]